MWLKTTRITLLLALLAAAAVLAYLGANPQLYANQVGKMISRNLLRESGMALSFRTFEGNPLRGLRFLDVSMVGHGRGRFFVYVRCDTLEVAYEPRALLAGEVHVHRLIASAPRVVLRRDVKVKRAPGPPPPLKLPTLGGRRVRVERLVLRRASAQVSSPLGRVQDELSRVECSASAVLQGGALSLDVQSLRGRFDSRLASVLDAHGRVTVRGDGVHFDGAHAQLDSTVVDVDGTVGLGTIDLHVQGQPVTLTEAFRVLSLGLVPRATLHGEARIQKPRADSDSVHIDAKVEGRLAGYDFSNMDFHASAYQNGMDVRSARGTFLGAQVEGSGQVGFKSSILTLNARMQGADLQQPWTGKALGWPQSDLAGDVGLTVHLVPPVWGDLSVERGQGNVLDLPVDSVRVALHFDDRQGVELHSARARCLNAVLTAEGSIDTSETMAILIHGRADDLRPWQHRYALPISGTGLDASGLLTGPSLRPRLHVGATLRTLDGFGFSAWGTQVVVELARYDSPDSVRCDLVSPGLHYHGRRVGGLEAQIRRAAPLTTIPSLLLATGDTTLTASGFVREGSQRQAEVTLSSLEFNLGNKEVWRLAHPAVAAVADKAVSVDAFDLGSSTGRVRLSGGLDERDRLALRLELEDGQLALLPRLGLGPRDLSGAISGLVSLGGTRQQPEFSARVEVDSATVAQRQFDRVQVALSSSASRITADSLTVESAQGRLRVDGAVRMPAADWLRRLALTPAAWRSLFAPASLDLHAVADQINPLYWQRPARPDTSLGWTSADLHAGGTAQAPRIAGDVTVVNLHSGLIIVPGVTAKIEADSSEVRIVDGKLLAPQPWLSVTGRLPLGVTVLGAPHWRPRTGIELRLASGENAPLDPLANIWPHFTVIGGSGHLLFVASGDPRAPTLTGELHIRNGVAQVERSLEKFRDIELDARFQNNVLQIERIDAHEGMRGEVKGTGELRFKGMVPDDISLDLTADRFQFITVPRLLALLRSNDLKLRLVRPIPGSPRAPKITGHVEVIQAEYTGEFAEAGTQAPTAPIVETDFPDWLADLDITTVGLVTINNRSFDVRVEGDVKFIRDEGGLGLAGVVDVPQGRVPIFNNDFTITSGRLIFSSVERMVPRVDITAVTNVTVYGAQREMDRRIEKVTVQMTGSLDQPSVAFSSESGYDRETIVRMLAGFSTDTGPQSTAIADVALAGALNQLERRLANDIGLVDTIDIDTGNTNVADRGTGTLIAVGKYLSPSFYVKYGQGFTVAERDVFLEYQVNRHLLFTTELRQRLRENVAATEYNLNVNYRVEY